MNTKKVTAIVTSIALMISSFAIYKYETRNISKAYAKPNPSAWNKIGFDPGKSPYDLNTVDGLKKEYLREMNAYVEFVCNDVFKIKPWELTRYSYNYGYGKKIYFENGNYYWSEGTCETDKKLSDKEIEEEKKLQGVSKITYLGCTETKINVPKLTTVKISDAYNTALKNYIADQKFKKASFSTNGKVTGLKVFRSNTSALVEFNRYGGAKKYNVYAKIKKRKLVKKKTKKHKAKYKYTKWSKYKLLGTVNEDDYSNPEHEIKWTKRQFVIYKKHSYKNTKKYKVKVVAVNGSQKSKYSNVVYSKQVKKKNVFFEYDILPYVDKQRSKHNYKVYDDITGKEKKMKAGEFDAIKKAVWVHSWEKAVKDISKVQKKKHSGGHVATTQWRYLKNKGWSLSRNEAVNPVPFDENTSTGPGAEGNVHGWYTSPGHRPGIIQGYADNTNMVDTYIYDSTQGESIKPFYTVEYNGFGVCNSSCQWKYKSGEWDGASEYVSGNINDIYYGSEKNEYRGDMFLCNGLPAPKVELTKLQEEYINYLEAINKNKEAINIAKELLKENN